MGTASEVLNQIKVQYESHLDQGNSSARNMLEWLITQLDLQISFWGDADELNFIKLKLEQEFVAGLSTDELENILALDLVNKSLMECCPHVSVALIAEDSDMKFQIKFGS